MLNGSRVTRRKFFRQSFREWNLINKATKTLVLRSLEREFFLKVTTLNFNKSRRLSNSTVKTENSSTLRWSKERNKRVVKQLQALHFCAAEIMLSLNSANEPKASQSYKTVFYKSKSALCASFKKDKSLQKETESTFINPVKCVWCVVGWSGAETLNIEWPRGVILDDVFLLQRHNEWTSAGISHRASIFMPTRGDDRCLHGKLIHFKIYNWMGFASGRYCR